MSALRLVIRCGTPALPTTLAERIDVQIDRLLALRDVAADERRGPERHDQLVDALTETGLTVVRIGRAR